MRGRTVAHIFEATEKLEHKIALLKAWVQQGISNEKIGHDTLDDAKYVEESNKTFLPMLRLLKTPSNAQSQPRRRKLLRACQ
jgi:hypothetical protein